MRALSSHTSDRKMIRVILCRRHVRLKLQRLLRADGSFPPKKSSPCRRTYRYISEPLLNAAWQELGEQLMLKVHIMLQLH